MPHQYSGENHDWDLTLRAAWCLLIMGQAAILGTHECRIHGVIVSPTSNPSGERNRVTV